MCKLYLYFQGARWENRLLVKISMDLSKIRLDSLFSILMMARIYLLWRIYSSYSFWNNQFVTEIW